MISHPVSRWAASGQYSATLLEPELIMDMHVLVHLGNETITYVYEGCERTTMIYGATFGPPFVFLHQMINRFK